MDVQRGSFQLRVSVSLGDHVILRCICEFVRRVWHVCLLERMFNDFTNSGRWLSKCTMFLQFVRMSRESIERPCFHQTDWPTSAVLSTCIMHSTLLLLFKRGVRSYGSCLTGHPFGSWSKETAKVASKYTAKVEFTMFDARTNLYNATVTKRNDLSR